MATSTLAARTSVRSPVEVRRQHPATAAALHEEVEGERALVDHRHLGPHGVHEGPLDLGAGGRATGVDDARQRVAALAGQLELAGRVAVEGGPERDELVHPRRALVDEHPHRVDVAEPGAGRQGVGEVEVGRVLVPPRTAATPPCAQRVVACWSSALVSTPTRMPWISAARTAADSPATPEPSTSRSRSATEKV